MLGEFDQEMATTRRLIERLLADNGDWKPHPKSFSIAHLAQLVSGMPGWITNAATKPSLDLAAGGKYTNETPATLLAVFDKHVGEARAALSAVSDEDMHKPWSLMMGGHAVWTAPRLVVIRTHLNHFYHHRGQLTVYLRLRDVPLPSIYGPTADEKMGGG
jgi:uncharacterized damage-inducible protein DinB